MSWDFAQAQLGLFYEVSGALAVFFFVIAAAGVLISRFDGIPLGHARELWRG